MKPPNIAEQLKLITSSLSGKKDADAETHAREFPLGKSRIHKMREAEQKRHRLRVRRLIRADNALDLVKALPDEPGDSTHALIPGDFEFADMLGVMIEHIGAPDAIHLTSLSASADNCKELQRLCKAYPGCTFSLAMSYFFKSTNKQIFAGLETRLLPLPNFKLAIGRLHTKIILCHVPRDRQGRERHLVIETSANLRACRNLEQVTAFECAGLYAFHLEWIREFHALADAGGYEHLVSFTSPEAKLRSFTPGK